MVLVCFISFLTACTHDPQASGRCNSLCINQCFSEYDLQIRSITSLGNLLELQVLKPNRRSTESATLRGKAQQLYSNKPSRWFWHTSSLELHSPIYIHWKPSDWRFMSLGRGDLWPMLIDVSTPNTPGAPPWWEQIEGGTQLGNYTKICPVVKTNFSFIVYSLVSQNDIVHC